MGAHVLLNLLNKLSNRDNMSVLLSILSLFHDKDVTFNHGFEKFNFVATQVSIFILMLDLKGRTLMLTKGGNKRQPLKTSG